jgi:hypothetical protein
MRHLSNSLDNVGDVDFTMDYPFDEPVIFPYFARQTLLPHPSRLITPPQSDYESVSLIDQREVLQRVKIRS